MNEFKKLRKQWEAGARRTWQIKREFDLFVICAFPNTCYACGVDCDWCMGVSYQLLHYFKLGDSNAVNQVGKEGTLITALSLLERETI